MDKETITLYVNGAERSIEIGPRTMLLDVLREDLGLTGTKNGCGQGHCGACTVLVDGQAVRSCIYLARRATGKKVETIEGLAHDGRLHPLQQAFIDQGAIQCGFCTPGMLMAAKALLDQSPRPSAQEVLMALEPNLCRCTGYSSIVRAVLQVSGQEAPFPLDLPASSLRAIGQSLPRPDAIAKVTGAARYAGDLSFEGMLHGAVVRSAHPHARVLRLDASAARAMPGIVTVLTADDIPGRRVHGIVRKDWPVLVGVGEAVRYTGDALAIVVAEAPDQADAARKTVVVEYEPLPGVFTPQAGLAANAPQLHDTGNLLRHIEVRKGDVEQGFAQASFVVEGTFVSPAIEHAFMEPEAAVAVPPFPLSREGGQGSRSEGEKGPLTVYCGSQIPFADRDQIAESLALPLDQVRVVQTAVGGGFGGKEDISVQIHAALAAYYTGRPVKIVLSREESMRTHPKRHPVTIQLRVGATQSGHLTAVRAEIYGDAGAYASLSDSVMTRTATHAAGPYIVPNVSVDCYAVYTNNPPSGAMRGFGVPQSALAIETAMDMLSEKLEMHPLELRRRNALRVGATMPTGQVLGDSVGLLETIDRVDQAVRELGNDMLAPSGPNKRRGWGFACNMKNVGLGGGAADSAGATVLITADGRVSVRIGAAEIGQGVNSIAAQIAAEVLGVPLEQVDVIVGDTSLTPDGGATTASRQTFITGNAVRSASEQVRAALLATAAEQLGVPADQLEVSGGQLRAAGGRALSFAAVAEQARRDGRDPASTCIYTPPKTTPLGQPGDDHFAYGFATQAALVEVDTQTGSVQVLQVVAAHDVGRAINPRAIVGQIEGGVVMGLGYALTEELIVQEGHVKNADLRRYHVPRSFLTPQILPILVEAPHRAGPFGAKGVGEITSIPTAPAITNGIYAAVGGRVYRLPATQERVLLSMREGEEGGA